TAYHLPRAPDGVTARSPVTELAPDVTTYGDSGLKPLTAYYYRIRAAVAGGYVPGFSAVVKATTLAAPAMPSNVSLKAISWTKVKVTWSDKSTNETGFEIQRSTSLTFNPNADYIVSANTIAFLDSTVSAKQLYYYRVRSFANGANSLWTRTSSLTTPADSTKLLPLAPSNASATALAGPVNKLTWKDNSAYELGFK